MKHRISEEQKMLVTVIISEIPRRSLEDFKESISTLEPETLRYLKQELSILVIKGHDQYSAAYKSL